MFGFIKEKLSKIYNQVSSKVSELFSKEVDEQTLNKLEEILISADTGVQSTRSIINELRERVKKGEIKEGLDLKNALESLLTEKLDKIYDCQADVILLVGINGSGKTTFAGKLANKYKKDGNKVLLAAGDTFRAAAVEQLMQWANRTGVDIEVGDNQQDPAAVVFKSCEKYKNGAYDKLIIDTAGRLQTKVNLMKELEKIRKVISKLLPDKKVCTLLTIDSMLGQNSLDQARIFNESTSLDGIVLTKMDGTAKGGIVVAITQELKVPVAYISFGENLDAVKKFDSQEYITQLLNE